MKSPGRSDRRTPAKHGVLDGMLGREVSVLPYAARKLGLPLDRLSWHDLTAGDAAVDGLGSTASPLIFAKHGLYSLGRPIFITATEIQPNTYTTLLANLAVHMPQLRNKRSPARYRIDLGEERLYRSDHNPTAYFAINGDGREEDFAQYGKGDWLFIYNDPNHIVDWALSMESLAHAVDNGARVCAMTTMGCNPGGLKRLVIDLREPWFDLVHSVNKIAKQLKSIDNLLVEIQRDDAQWAYLLTRPYKWSVPRDRQAIADIFHREMLSVKIFSMRDEPADFEECCRRLFLRRKERDT